jgi:hypothetical protein
MAESQLGPILSLPCRQDDPSSEGSSYQCQQTAVRLHLFWPTRSNPKRNLTGQIPQPDRISPRPRLRFRVAGTRRMPSSYLNINRRVRYLRTVSPARLSAPTLIPPSHRFSGARREPLCSEPACFISRSNLSTAASRPTARCPQIHEQRCARNTLRPARLRRRTRRATPGGRYSRTHRRRKAARSLCSVTGRPSQENMARRAQVSSERVLSFQPMQVARFAWSFRKYATEAHQQTPSATWPARQCVAALPRHQLNSTRQPP